ncbi:MAG: tetratricopeptide repeat protein [Acidobacteria bacterium]|nr:tetratricopeptide repeat protein [Acidobacteriota bacterium]
MTFFVARGLLLVLTLLPRAVCGASQNSGDAADPRQAAIRLEQQGRTEEAEDAWRKLVTTQPTAEAYAHLGLLEARQENYRQALPWYRKALALDPSMPGLEMNLGLALFKAGELKQAIVIFNTLRKTQAPLSPEALRLTTLIGIAQYGLRDYQGAIPNLKQAIATDPENLPFRLLLAESCLAAKHFQCVLDVYHQILALNAESAEADMLAGEALDEMNDKAGATEQFRAAVKANRKEPNVHFGLGYLLWTQNQFEEAAEQFQAELANVPQHVQALTYLADANIKINHPERALPLLQKAIRLAPEMELAHLDLGVVYDDQGHRDQALRELKMAARLSPDDVKVHWKLARLYQAMGRKNEADTEFAKTKSLTKAADDSVTRKLEEARGRAKQAESVNAPR